VTLEINDAFIGLANAGFSSDPSADYYISAAVHILWAEVALCLWIGAFSDQLAVDV